MIEKILRALHIAVEGKSIIIILLLISILLCGVFPTQSFLLFLIFCLLLLFFRDPIRHIPDNSRVIVSPANGTIMDIDIIVTSEFGDQPFRRIGIFLSIFDVHVQRFPYAGEVEKIKYMRGKFYLTFLRKSSKENESNTLVIKTDQGPMMIKQIAGLITRRIVCNVPIKKRVTTGEKLGMILFGSRVELYIPIEIELRVKIGDKVVDGETVIGIGK